MRIVFYKLDPTILCERNQLTSTGLSDLAHHGRVLTQIKVKFHERPQTKVMSWSVERSVWCFWQV